MEWIFWISVAAVWLISPIILLIALIVSRHRLQELRQRLAAAPLSSPPVSSLPPPQLGSGRQQAPVDLENLLLLRLELQRQLEAGVLTAERHRQLIDELDEAWSQHLRETGAWPENAAWQRRRAAAWNLLTQRAVTPLGAPPWPAAALAPDRPPVQEEGIAASTVTASVAEQPALEPLPVESSSLALEPKPVTVSRSRQPVSPPPVRRPVRTAAKPAPVWQPTAPNPLEKALQALSGWPKLIAPFLAQNVGWFIGGFCFVAGALFLIANTSGFVNALVVFGSLLGATAFLLWAGYQFRRQRPELAVASGVLLTLAMLLAPLDLAVAVRLMEASQGDTGLMLISVLLATATLGALTWAAALASALMDRALQGAYPRLLAALAALQLAVPLAALAPGWPGLAALHGVLLGLLGYSLWRFTGEWLRRLFIDRQLTSYYAAGLLVYTAIVSFVHLTWVWPTPLPAGYAGPFLMALCGLLFPVDAAFKEWVAKYAVLSRFSFALYALSIVAVAVAIQTAPTAIVTLALGALLYGWITWRYRTLTPLYLLFGCVAGLYGFGVLRPLPAAGYELASLPGLLALLALGRWAGARSRSLALQCLLTFGVLLGSLTAWSLIWAGPGILGFATAATAALLGYVAVRLALRLPEPRPSWAGGDAFVVVLATVAMAYLPDWLPFGWSLRTAFGLLILAALWTGLGVHDRRQLPIGRRIFIVGALVNVALALILGGLALWPDWLGRLEPILLLTLAGALLLWLSLGLRQQALFYGVLALAAASGVLIKQGYFPGPSTGLVALTLVLGLWLILWRLNWRERVRHALQLAAGENQPAMPTLTALLRAPLEQAMALLWAVGLIQLAQQWLAGAVGVKWLGAMGLAIGSSVLLIGYFRQFRWLALPMLLGLAGLLVGLDQLGWRLPGLGLTAVLYALLVWRAGIVLLAQPLTGRLATALDFTTPGGSGGRRQAEESLHGCALLIATVPVAAGPALGALGWPAPQWLPVLTASLLLFSWTGAHYRTALHAWAALLTGTVGVWLLGAWQFPAAPFALGQPLYNTLLSFGMAVAAVGLEHDRAEGLSWWRMPLRAMSGLLYLLALGGAVLGALLGDPRLPILLGLLCVALFPVARFLPNAAEWRGLGLAVLSGAWVWSVAMPSGVGFGAGAGLTVVWSYALWFGGNAVLPRWNARWPNWAVAPAIWPLLGLIGVLSGVIFGVMVGAWSPAGALTMLAPYLFLSLRNTAWSGMAWLAVAALAGSGWLAGGALDWRGWGWADQWALLGQGFAATLVWLNLLLLLGALWQRHGHRVVRWLAWRQAGLDAPLFWIPFTLLGWLLARLLWVEAGGLLWDGAFRLTHSSGALTGLALLLAATAAHAGWLRRTRLTVHVLLAALATVVLAILLDSATPLFGLPLAVALWDGALLLAWRYGPREVALWRAALQPWLMLLPLVSLGWLWLVADAQWTVCALTLLTLALVTLAQGWWQRQLFWLKAGWLLALLGGYAAWLMMGRVPFASAAVAGLLAWYALQTVLAAFGLMAIRRWLAVALRKTDPDTDEDRFAQLCDAEQAITELIPWLLGLSLLELGGHVWLVLAYRAGWGPSPWLIGSSADVLAAGMALLALTGLTVVRAWRQPDESRWIYAAALLLGLLGAYGRLIALGLAAFTPWDTIALFAAAGVALGLHQWSGLPALARLALLLPALAVATAPWQLASPWTGGALLTAAVLYLSQASTLGNPWPLYLGVLALNGAVYLWAPLWAARYGLWQFYIVPAAVSVLALLQLHRRELRPKVLNGARLAALSALYAGAGLDVFLRPELSVFVLALALALTGIVLGIALRIRAFLYTGVAFLVLNVIGQLVRFYPEQGLSRALILIGLGAAITAGMVVFNLQREAILRRIRVMRADLAEWE